MTKRYKSTAGQICSTIWLLLISYVTVAAEQASHEHMAQRIKSTFESQLFQLPPRIQGHYGIRLYRISGQQQYLPAALYDYYVVNDRMHALRTQLNDADAIAAYSQQLIAQLGDSTRGKARRRALAAHPSFIFYADQLLRYAARLHEFGVAIPEDVKLALQNYDFGPALTDPVMIRAWAAQLANYVYWLRDLGIADHRLTYKTAFLAAYPNSQDDSLTRWHFRNKLYGLTHFVFAASQYYQQFVSASEFEWIIDYFRANQQRILKQASEDIKAEVGLVFLLCQQNSEPMLALLKQSLASSFDQQAGMIPSVNGRVDLATGEHRNVLAYMLFNWPPRLHRGPIFNDMAELKPYLPAYTQHSRSLNDGHQ
ncbi:DUF3541 domain-containing protein [Thalassotalea ponticola]|uniref:DUF3541 domain-containing protein n=1 Tax=Thalassotalea ponticola TaxID=1523392 RepID=UPI0025B43D17|nr:DUF3541 domain-containing protein [Thalassotalea ponticola]MDN3653743.1 DUF3541 domain-containing protein [Thalassotalea ponticola]